MCSRECILDLHEHICSLYIRSDKNTSAAVERLHWFQASMTKSIPTQQERATANMLMWCSPSNVHLAVLPYSYVAMGQLWLEEDLTFDILSE